MRSACLTILLLPLAACGGAQPRGVAFGGYNVPQAGGAGMTPIGAGGLTAQIPMPANTGAAPAYNTPQAGGAGLVPIGQGGVSVQPFRVQSGGEPIYNLPQAGGAGMAPIGADGVQQPATQ